MSNESYTPYAAACKKYKGIIFTDSKGKIIDDNSPDNDNEDNHSTEIAGVDSTQYNNTDNTNNTNNNITGVGTNKYTTGVGTNEYTTGVGNIANTGNNTITREGNIANTGNDEIQLEELPVPDLQETHTTQETDDEYMYEGPTRHKREVIEEMNVTNMPRDTEFENEGIDASVTGYTQKWTILQAMGTVCILD